MKAQLAAVALLVAACASLSEKGKLVELTDKLDRVKNCQILGEVKSSPPYGLPDDWKKQLRNQSGELGGNVVYAESKLVTTSIKGKAYRCP
jgi:hypothetical protein